MDKHVGFTSFVQDINTEIQKTALNLCALKKSPIFSNIIPIPINA